MDKHPFIQEMEDMKNDNCKKPIPFFEIGVVLFMGFAGVSFMLVDADVGDVGALRGLLVDIVPLYVWGVIQLITCIFLGVGLLMDKEIFRKIGLGLAFLVFMTYAISYITDVRLVGGVYGINSIVCLLSMFYVHETEL